MNLHLIWRWRNHYDKNQAYYPPFLAAWLANITFGLFGIYLFMNIPQ
ncbi:MAG: hypothetical protein HQK58_02875 [Deltaproteobacteria bacterium]|nr:hypothetical protein [Deltaproteobacteria bacterium]